MKTGEGFVLVYSVTSKQSYEFTTKLRQNILRMKGEDMSVCLILYLYLTIFLQFPVVLAGNKKDLTAERQVSEQEGKELAEKFNVPFLETSAKTNENVNEVFFTLVRQINKWRKDHPDKSKKGRDSGSKKKCTIL